MASRARSTGSMVPSIGVAAACALLVGCAGGAGKNAEEPPPTPPGARVVFGSVTTLASAELGSAGGTLSGPAGSPLEGVQVRFPPGALERTTRVSLGTVEGSVTPVIGRFGGLVLSLVPEGVRKFEQPVQVTMPFRGPDATPVPYWIGADGRLQLVDLLAIDRAQGTFTFGTWHASSFTYLLDDPPGVGADPVAGAFDSGFTPEQDGFQVVNFGTAIVGGGECTGFTAFAQWYFLTQRSAGPLYGRFMGAVTGAVTGQEVIATRAWISINLQWNSYSPMLVSQLLLSDVGVYALVRNAIANTGAPVMIHLQSGLFDAADLGQIDRHSALAYRVDGGTIWIYDPNHPHRAGTNEGLRTLRLRDGEFEVYEGIRSGYTQFSYVGSGSLWVNEPYLAIYRDALENFHGSEQAKITIASHAAGATVTERNPTIRGKVESGRVLVDRIEVQVNDQNITAEVLPSGDFSLVVPLRSGRNPLRFYTLGELPDVGRIAVPNDQLVPFELVGVFDKAAILLTLSWDRMDTDVDLYVTDPGGETSWYARKVTPDGGELDVDNTSGRGPEHWTLTYGDTVRFGEGYRVRVHYYSSRGHGPINWVVTALLNEGTPSETRRSYSGSIAEASSGNSAPGSSGTGWADVAVLTPTQP